MPTAPARTRRAAGALGREPVRGRRTAWREGAGLSTRGRAGGALAGPGPLPDLGPGPTEVRPGPRAAGRRSDPSGQRQGSEQSLVIPQFRQTILHCRSSIGSPQRSQTCARAVVHGRVDATARSSTSASVASSAAGCQPRPARSARPARPSPSVTRPGAARRPPGHRAPVDR